MVLSRTRRLGENMSVGGLLPNTLKKLKGERFGCPASFTVLAKQMGRGAIAPNR
jgi:hypothetical protein